MAVPFVNVADNALVLVQPQHLAGTELDVALLTVMQSNYIDGFAGERIVAASHFRLPWASRIADAYCTCADAAIVADKPEYLAHGDVTEWCVIVVGHFFVSRVCALSDRNFWMVLHSSLNSG